jgi:hypothetical protein
MKLWKLLALLAVPGLLFVACGTDEDEEEGYSAPYGLAVSVYYDGRVTLEWSGATGTYLGYRVYAGEMQLANLDADDIEDYLVTTLGIGTTQYSLSLPSDQYYFVHIRAYAEDSDKPSNEIEVIARPEGTATLYEFDSPAPNASGFDLSTGETVSMATTNTQRHTKVDFWVGYASATQYTPGDDALYFWNPKDAAAAYNNTASFLLLGSGAWENYRGWSGSGWVSSIQITSGAVYAVQVTDQLGNTHYSKIKVQSAPAGTYPDRTVNFRWAYQPMEDVPYF